MMRVLVDDVWASPSTLHVRVTVYDADMRWRHRYYPAISLDQVPTDALAPLLGWLQQDDGQQMTLFDT